MLPLCRHIFHDGRSCHAPAVHNTLYCRHHRSVKTALAKSTPRPDPFHLHDPIPFVFPEDRAALQLNFFLVLQAFNARKIDARTANCMTYNLQSCLTNLGKRPLVEPDSEPTVQRIILTPEGEEIAPPREALEEGENPPLHHKNCPCQRCAEQFREAPAEQHHPNCSCGLCEPQSVSQQSESAEPNAAGEQRSAAIKHATAEKLYNRELTRDPANKQVNLYDYLYGEHHKKYEAQYAARAKAAIEAGIEPPPYEPFALNKIELECEKRYKATMEQVEKNKQIAREIRERRFGKEELEPKPEFKL